ncbi:MAG: primosomal replication protein N [Gammaproteobacteria bacterium]
METNRLTITGLVVEVGAVRVSPAGIPQQHITIEHRSRQVEAGTPREARCRLDVKIAGEELAGIVRTLAVGQQVGIEGFLTRSGFKGSEASLVVHATRIERKGDATGQDH